VIATIVMGTRRAISAVVLAVACTSASLQNSFTQSSNIKQGVFINLDGAPSMGAKTAKVTIVEFSDYQCPLSSRHFNWTMEQLVNDYVKTGKLRYVFRDFPVESIHPVAIKAAEAAHCAGDQGKYWQMHDRFFRNQMSVAPELLPLHAKMLNLDVKRFQQCLDNGSYSGMVRESIVEGTKIGVRGTPAFFLGLTDTNESRLTAVTFINGTQPYATFKEAIVALLSQASE
jgi:protein-disulfide isomerase